MDCNKDKDYESIENVDADENHDSSNIEIEIFFMNYIEVVHCLN